MSTQCFLGGFVILCLIGVGVTFFARDWQWERHEANMRAQGIVNVERTPEWDNQQNMLGVILIIGAIVMFFLSSR
jgi:hypothetical protein